MNKMLVQGAFDHASVAVQVIAEQTTAGLELTARLETRVRAFALTPIEAAAAIDEDIFG